MPESVAITIRSYDCTSSKSNISFNIKFPEIFSITNTPCVCMAYIIAALPPTSESIADTCNTVDPTAIFSTSDTEYNGWLNCGRSFVSVTWITKTAEFERGGVPLSVAIIVNV